MDNEIAKNEEDKAIHAENETRVHSNRWATTVLPNYETEIVGWVVCIQIYMFIYF